MPPREDGASPAASVKSRPVTPAESVKSIAPPISEPPFIRGKKPATEKVVTKRRERDMPEFEESDDDDEKPTFVKQPLPFGVLKQPVPPSPAEAAAAAEKQREKDLKAEMLAIEPPSTVPVPAPVPPSAASVKEKSALSSPPPPSTAIETQQISAFAPPPPAPEGAVVEGAIADKYYDDSVLGRSLTRGRLSMKCVEGFEMRKRDEKDPNARIDPFIRFRLGVAERHPWKRTETKRKQNANPKFGNEIVFFDVIDPAQFVFQEDVQLCIELWNKGTLADELIGSVTMSVVRFLKAPFVSYTEKIPVYYPGMQRTQMKVRAHVNIMPYRPIDDVVWG